MLWELIGTHEVHALASKCNIIPCTHMYQQITAVASTENAPKQEQTPIILPTLDPCIYKKDGDVEENDRTVGVRRQPRHLKSTKQDQVKVRDMSCSSRLYSSSLYSRDEQLMSRIFT